MNKCTIRWIKSIWKKKIEKKNKRLIIKLTDEVIEEPGVIMCNTDERMHDPPKQKNGKILNKNKQSFTSNGVGPVCTILLIKLRDRME